MPLQFFLDLWHDCKKDVPFFMTPKNQIDASQLNWGDLVTLSILEMIHNRHFYLHHKKYGILTGVCSFSFYTPL